ncbi:MAG: histone deacetylase family protein [Alphaproteobacteria bacterium]|nr:histone deacetylase family protein [Alphaproteobacteria bacterium]MCB9698315.1 histone deacetylase family protein [Alphaproteobacteria bacterium]
MSQEETTRLLVYDHQGMAAHEPDWANPEQPIRLHAARAAMTGFPPVIAFEQTGLVHRSDLLRIHDPIYVDWMLSLEEEEDVVPIDLETAVGPGTVVAACLASGAAVEATRRVLAEDAPVRRALVLSRPPGHHATADRAMGYCYFNHVAVAAAAAREAGAERVLVVDWDVHPGNGTEALLGGREGFAVVDLHEEGQWPVPEGEAPENVRRVPLPTGSEHATLVAALRERLLPEAETFRPDLVLVSAGFDAHEDDPLGGLCASDDTFLEWARTVREVADRYAGGRIVVVLEGGYDILALGRGLRQVVTALIEDPARPRA